MPEHTTAAEVLYTSIMNNTQLLTLVESIKARGKLLPSDIPGLVLCVLLIYNTDKTVIMTTPDVKILLEKVYNALVEKYNLVEDANRGACLSLFDLSLQLALTTPIVQQEGARCWAWFTHLC
jgi:hypothetical protein